MLVIPDHVRENFAPGTGHGGEDAPDGRGFRYLEWHYDPDPEDETYEVAYAVVLREADGSVRLDGDRHLEGLFPRAVWLELLERAGFEARCVTDPWDRDLFIGTRRGR